MRYNAARSESKLEPESGLVLEYRRDLHDCRCAPRTFPGERRVALVPAVIPTLAKGGLQVVVEAGAVVEAGYPDADYAAKGAKVLADRAEVFRAADILTQVLCYGSNDRTGKADLPLF